MADLITRFERTGDPARRRGILRSLYDLATAGQADLGPHRDRLEALRGAEADPETRGILLKLLMIAQTHATTGVTSAPAPPLRDTTPTQPGRRLEERYRMEDSGPLFWGGYGDIFQAKTRDSGRVVAIKFLRGEMAKDSKVAARFEREAEVLAWLHARGGHRFVLPYYDHGVQDGRAYLVTAWATGKTVKEAMQSFGNRLPLAIGTALMLQVLEGLAWIHSCDVVHRDLKPSNLYLCKKDGQYTHTWIGDFGLSLLGNRTRFTAEGARSPLTPQYAAPEQFAGAHEQDARTDLFGWAATAFAVFVGRPRFPSERSVVKAGAAVTELWDQQIARCLAKNPAERPATAAELLETLDR